MNDLDILGLLQAFEHTMEFGAMPKGYDRTQLRAAIKRLERAEIVEGWASKWCGRWTWHGPRKPEESRSGVRYCAPAVLIVLEDDDE